MLGHRNREQMLTGKSATEHGTVAVKSRDTWWTILVIDPIATPLVGLLTKRSRVTPNKVSLASLATAFIAGGSFATGHLVIGAIVYQVAFLLDCMDGKLANTRHTASASGALVDTVTDQSRFSLCLIGLAVGLDADKGWLLLAIVYACVHCSLVMVGPSLALPRHPVWIAASPRAALRSARGRLAKPGSTVDTEAIAFTIAPILGAATIGLAVSLAIDAIFMLAQLARAFRPSR
jgi:phosphatidylglycerophosphate synthase